MQTIEIKMNWEYAMSVAILGLTNGNAEGQKIAKDEIMKCAALADKLAEGPRLESIEAFVAQFTPKESPTPAHQQPERIVQERDTCEHVFSSPMQAHYDEITEETHSEQLDVLPPIYIKILDGEVVQNGFAVAEPYSMTSEPIEAFEGKAITLPTFHVYFKKGDKYYHTIASIGGVTFNNYNAKEYTRGNVAKTDVASLERVKERKATA